MGDLSNISLLESGICYMGLMGVPAVMALSILAAAEEIAWATAHPSPYVALPLAINV